MKNIILIFFIFNSILLQSNNFNYGLHFKSYKNLGKERTSLVLNEGKPLKIEDEISISFNMLIRNETVFGNVFKIVSNTNESITLVFSADERDIRYPSLTISNSFYPITNTVELEKWFNVKITISTKANLISLQYKDIEKSYPFVFKNWENIKVSFGVCPFVGFETYEAAPMNLKNIEISKKEKVIRHWVLREHKNNICYDSIKQIAAITQNPIWIIDSHIQWKKKFSKHFENNNNPQYAYDAKRDLLYLVPDEKSIIVYNPVTNTDSIIVSNGGYTAGINTNAMVYDSINDQLISYSLEEQTISRFSFDTQRWSKNTICTTETKHWHHTASVSMADTSIVAFGGYGQYMYNNDFYRIGLTDNSWTTNKLVTISPRYSSASVVVDNKLYIFGGRGSETGKQEVNTQYYYDLHSIDLKTNEVKLIWENPVGYDFIPCGNMIYNPDNSCFYVLVNIDNGTLLCINPSSKEITKVSTGIDQSLEADFPFYTLFYSPNLKKIFALFSMNYNKGYSNLSFFSIDYPPLSRVQILQTVSVHDKYSPWVFICISIIVAGVSIFFIYRKKKISKTENNQAHIPKEDVNTVNTTTNNNQLESSSNYVKINISDKNSFDRSKNCISLLGGFNVKDKEGVNVSPNFTPILKNLLLLILLYSEAEEKGINDKKIDNLLWADKESKSARNNRNVSLSRLKVLLESINGVSLTNNGGFWKISFEQDTLCDYFTSMQYIKNIKSDESKKANVSEMLELFMYGPLLPYTHADWLDKFKSNYSNEAIDILYNMLLSEETAKDEELSLQIADTIFLFDSLNEEALSIKCSILYNSGKKGLAKNAYDIFIKEYKALLGEDYKHSITQVLELSKRDE